MRKINGIQFYQNFVNPRKYDIYDAGRKQLESKILVGVVKVNSHPPDQQGGYLIDLGSGTGICGKTAFLEFNNHFEKCILVDASHKMLDYCKNTICKTDSRFEVQYANLEQDIPIPIKNEVASLVVSNALTIYLSNLDTFIAESARMLKKGGMLAFDAILHKENHPRSIEIEDDEIFIYQHSLKGINKKLIQNGFTNIFFNEPNIIFAREGNTNIYAVKQ